MTILRMAASQQKLSRGPCLQPQGSTNLGHLNANRMRLILGFGFFMILSCPRVAPVAALSSGHTGQQAHLPQLRFLFHLQT